MGKTNKLVPIIVPAPKFLQKAFKDYMVSQCKQTYYKKLKKGYSYYCHACGKKQHLSDETFKQVRYSYMCPNCCSTTSIHKKPFRKHLWKQELFSWIDEKGQEIGYYCLLTEKGFYCVQVAYWKDNNFYARYISKFMCSITFNKHFRKKFTKRNHGYYSYNSLENSFYSIMEGNEPRYKVFMPPKTYREFLEENIKAEDYKSNQLYIIKNNLLNLNQIKAIKYFDLKSINEVYKYRKYIDKCSFNNRVLNIYYLDYLAKNNIPYGDFMDYARDLETLGYKLDKPKDFYDRHEKVGELIEIKNNEKYRKGIEKSFKKLKKKGLESKNYSIKPIANLEEINHVAKSLHNCMARMYTQSYAKGETDLYCLWKDEKPFIAIEVLDGNLEQVRADHNEVPERKYKSIVTKWYRGAYAR